MVELRKRKTPPVAPPKPARKKSSTAPKESKVAKIKEAVKKVVKPSDTKEEASVVKEKPVATGPPTVGSTIDVASFGGEVETHDGTKTTLAKLVEESKAGVVIFTYPKASTPGCTKQACFFRDEYEPLTATGLSIYGLSGDKPSANTSFRNKNNLSYTLLCDPNFVLIKPLGLAKAPKSTLRGVFVVRKSGEVLAIEQASPSASVEVMRKIVASMGGGAGDLEKTALPTLAKQPTQEEKEAATNADEVADSAAKLDGTPKPAA